MTKRDIVPFFLNSITLPVFPRQTHCQVLFTPMRAAGMHTSHRQPQTASATRPCLGLLRYHPYGVNDYRSRQNITSRGAMNRVSAAINLYLMV